MADYVKQAEQALQEVIRTGEAVANKYPDEASLAITIAATEEVKKVIDPTSAVGRILVATLLEDAAWKLGNNHAAFGKMREAAATLNPRKSKL